MPKTTPRRLALLVAAALIPWCWFVVRDLAPEFDAVAIGMPLLLLGEVAGGADRVRGMLYALRLG